MKYIRGQGKAQRSEVHALPTGARDLSLAPSCTLNPAKCSQACSGITPPKSQIKHKVSTFNFVVSEIFFYNL